MTPSYRISAKRRQTPSNRHLDWEGCFNVRDLGGLETSDGRVIRRGALVRGDAPDRLTATGWAALQAHGIKTIVDLRNDDELAPDAGARPQDVATVHVPLDGVEDAGFWAKWGRGPEFATPLYYRAHLNRMPERSARAIATIAGAAPGGVLVHCVGGRDRTGQIAMLTLALLGVAPENIAADYALSAGRLEARNASRGETDPDSEATKFLASKGTSAERIIVSTLAELDVVACLRRGGLGDDSLAALRERLLEPQVGLPQRESP